MSECYFLYNSKLDKWECDKDNCFAWRTPLEHNSALANEVKDLERKLAEVMTGLTLIESSLINLRPRDKSPIDRRFGDLIKDIVQLKEKG